MRSEKQFLLDGIEKGIHSSPALILAQYNKMTPNMAAAFRVNIKKAGGRFEVVKKRVFLKAAEKAGLVLNREDLAGHVGVIFATEDPISATKCLYDFRKANKDTVEVLGGMFEGAICSAADVELISKLPSKDEMRAQLLGLFEAPMSQTLAVVEALLTSVMFCLDNKVEKSNEKSV